MGDNDDAVVRQISERQPDIATVELQLLGSSDVVEPGTIGVDALRGFHHDGCASSCVSQARHMSDACTSETQEDSIARRVLAQPADDLDPRASRRCRECDIRGEPSRFEFT